MSVTVRSKCHLSAAVVLSSTFVSFSFISSSDVTAAPLLQFADDSC